MINITINGRKITLDRAVSVLDAAESNGIAIPHFCSHPLLERFGGCRMCLVEVDKMPRLQTSCTLIAAEGMVVRTESAEISKARKSVLEFLLINHPLDCGVCDKAGECVLQDYTHMYGASEGRFAEKKKREPESLKDPLIVRNMERCIMCTRCVRMCDGVQGDSAIAVTGRGARTFIEPFSGERYDCEYCGNCLFVCPVGAIMSRLHRHTYRPWWIDSEVRTVCAWCGVGCSMTLQMREDKIVRAQPIVEAGPGKGLLCARGYFGYDFPEDKGRLTTPLIRRGKGEKLEPATWDEALDTVARKLVSIRDTHGGQAIAGIASSRCTNEDNYLFQKLMRMALKTNSIDSAARMGYLGAQDTLDALLGPGATANVISGIPNSDAVIVIGGDPTALTPVLGVRVRGAFKNGAKVITIGHTPGLARFRAASVSAIPYAEGAAIGAFLRGLAARRKWEGAHPAIGDVLAELAQASFDEALTLEVANALDSLGDASSVSLVIGPDLAARPDGLRNIVMAGAMAHILDARVYLLSEGPNVQGLIDMGCAPDRLPGGIPVTAKERAQAEGVWGASVPGYAGLTLLEMVGACHSGALKAMFVMGENPVFHLPSGGYVKEAMGKLDFLVVQDIFMSETAELADVVLPASGWSEKDGTFTNLERRVQIVRRAAHGPGKEDWRILKELGVLMGLAMPYETVHDVMAETGRASTLHAGLDHEEITRGMDLWPYKGKPFLRPVEPQLRHMQPTAYVSAYNSINLSLDKHLFHSGTLCRHSSALMSIAKQAEARFDAKAAEALGVKDGDTVRISSPSGELILTARINKNAPPMTVLLTNVYRDKGAMTLMEFEIEPTLKTPALKNPVFRVEKLTK